MTFLPRVLVLIGCSCIGFPLDAGASALTHLWSRRFGDANSQSAGLSVATDASRNVIVAGAFPGTVNFGGGNLTSAGGFDIFVAKFDTTGTHEWSQRFGDVTDQSAYSVATDGSGNVIVAGGFVGTVNFGGNDLTSAGLADIFVAKFDAAGVHQWSQRFGDQDNQLPKSVATDASGNVIVTGDFAGAVDFGGGSLTSAGSGDIFVAKLNSAGVHQWSQRFGDQTNQVPQSVTTDANGNVVVTGGFGGTVDFGGGALTSAGLDDIFVAKFGAGGVHQWSQRFGDASNQLGQSVATDASGNVIVAGPLQGAADFGGGSLTSAGSVDIFVAKFDAGGVHQWSQRFGDPLGQFPRSVATDARGNVILVGDLGGMVDFGGGNLTSAGSADIFIAQFDAGGDHQWSRHFGDANAQVGQCVATDAGRNVIVAGAFQGTVNFGGGNLTSAGGLDIFLAKFGSLEPAIASILDVGNDQGRRVRIQFSRSAGDDASGSPPVLQYEAYRRNDDVAAATIQPPTATLSRDQLVDLGWVYAGSVPAHGVNHYLMDAATDADSTVAQGQHYSVFFIRAATAMPTTFYDSPPDSGYSLDNLSPGVPMSLAHSGGVLTWQESTAEDFDYFSVYGSDAAPFATATLIGHTVPPSMDVSSSPYAYYHVTATDFSGNEGDPAGLHVATGVDGPPRSYVLSISSYPNPFNPETTIRYTVPWRGRVLVSIYDARGSQVVTLVDEEKDAGAHTMGWRGTDARGGSVSSGVYFARVTHASGTEHYRMALLK
jgi:hypothetical protein